MHNFIDNVSAKSFAVEYAVPLDIPSPMGEGFIDGILYHSVFDGIPTVCQISFLGADAFDWVFVNFTIINKSGKTVEQLKSETVDETMDLVCVAYHNIEDTFPTLIVYFAYDAK